MNQQQMPFVEALEDYKEEHYVPFHTPGHKIGGGAHPILQSWMGPALSYDLGVMYALDDLHEPEGALKEAQELTAQLYGAEHCWFSINGTTALIEAMIMGIVSPDETIIIPREAHRSVVSGLVLSGAKPVYMNCEFDERWGIPLGVTLEDAVETMDAHPEAKAILLVYPNYYGVGVDIKNIVKEAHKRNLVVLVDEAHGPHLPFVEALPIEAIEAGADLVAQSTHKSLGSLTQTSWLLGQGNRFQYRRITQIHQMLQSTSPNYIFLASLDMARHQLAMEGTNLVNRTVSLSLRLRRELSSIAGISVMCGEDVDRPNYDVTKVLIDAKELGITGVNFEKRLRAHHIEVELVQAHHVLVLITIGDTEESIMNLVKAVQAISDEICSESSLLNHMGGQIVDRTKIIQSASVLPTPVVRMTPREALYKNRRTCSLKTALHRICGETIAYYPPGIPCVAVGEEITESVLQYIQQRRALGYVPNGAADMSLETIQVVEE